MGRKFISAEVEITSRDRTKPGIDSAKKSVGGLTKMVKAYGAEIGAAIAAMYGVYKVLKDVASEYLEAEKAVSEMDRSLKSTGIYTPTLSRELQDMAGALQGVTVYSDEAIESAAGLLQTFGDLSEEGLKQAIPAMLDFSTATKMDLNQAAMLFGKTLGSDINALSRYGVEMKAGMSQTEELATILKWVSKHANDAARAMGSTLSGQLIIMNNQISEMKETLGGMVADILPFWIDHITNAAKALNSFLDAIQGVNREIDDSRKIMDGMNKEQLTQHISFLKQEIDRHTENAKALRAESENMDINKRARKDAAENLKDEIAELARTREEYNKYNFALRNYEERHKAAKKATKDSTGEQKDYVKLITETRDMIDYLGLDYGFYTTALRQAENAQKDLTGATQNYLPYVSEMVDQYGRAIAGQAEIFFTTAKSAEEVLADTKEKYQDAVGYFQDFFDTIGMASSVHYANQRADLDEWYLKQKKIIDDTITDETDKAAAIKALDDEMLAREKQIKIDEAKAKKKFALFDIAIDTARGMVEALPSFWKVAAVAAVGAAQAAIVASQKIPEYAKGGSFITQGPQLMMVGDNPSGRERVTVTPEENSEYQGESAIFVATVNVDGNQLFKIITRAIRSKQIPIYKGALVSS